MSLRLEKHFDVCCPEPVTGKVGIHRKRGKVSVVIVGNFAE